MKRSVLLSLVLTLFVAAGLRAQQTTGSISGRVLDPQKKAVPSATIQARDVNTGVTRIEVADDEGFYRLVAPVGTYAVTAEHDGFTPTTIQDIEVALGRTNIVDVTLSLPNLVEKVDVIDRKPIDPTTSSVGQNVDLGRVNS